jgi:hypothetical protein
MRNMEWLVKPELAGDAEENLPESHFAHHNFQWPDLGSNPGRSSGKPVSNRLSSS